MKINLGSKLDAIVAQVRAEVEIRKRGNRVVVETTKTREAREKRENGSDPALAALMRASNATIFHAKPDPYRHFHEVGRQAVLQKQFCRCCEGEQINVVAEFLHLRGRRDKETPTLDVWIRRSSTNTSLPHEQPRWAPPYAVEFCAECTMVGAQTACWEQEVHDLIEGNGQLPLLN